MKKIELPSFLIIILLLVGSKSFCQEKFTTYESSYSKEVHNIQISIKSDEKFSLFIDAKSLDNIHKTGGILIDEKNYQNFINGLSEAKIKFNEWIQTAKENNVRELDKEMPIKSRAMGYFLYGNEWHFQYVIDLKFSFKIFESNDELKYYLIVRSGVMQSSKNQFMKVDGVVLVFSSETEIQDFINTISMEKINEFKNKPKAEDLFN